jgi:small conductance mechanosensitive channel
MSRRAAFVVVVVASLGVAAGTKATEDARDPAIVGDEQHHAISAALVGEWSCEIGSIRRRLEFHSDGQFEIGSKRGSYRVEGKTLALQTDDRQVVYQITLSGKDLTLSEGDLVEPLKFTKVSRFGESSRWRTDWSLSAVKPKLRRIAIIFLIVAISLGTVRLIRAVLQMIVWSEWGPLKFVYRNHKKRTMTIHSLVLNISKYVIYLLAIGFVLTELGVNYTMYFASLSVVGLAIGFGSQGLVQDMVTGFFIVFEEQFNVGDMVEIPPHTGIVEELGLRMTRLRNYLGQRVTIPNRNIAVVGNYVRGAQQVYLDVSVTSATNIENASGVLGRIANEIAGQFPDIILSGPRSLGEVSLATGERFLRLHLAIWPQQQWVIDQEMVPRIRTGMKSEGLDIPGDKIVVYYHQRESRPVSRHG